MADVEHSSVNDAAERWMQAWRGAGPALERVRRDELRSLDGRRARLLGLPLPPGPVIAIEPEELAGTLDPQRGDLCLRLRARFRFRLFSLYRAPDLLVDTELVTAAVQGRRHCAEGRPLDADGNGVLVGVASIQPSGDTWFDRFLGLPDEALAVLRCRLVPAHADALATLPSLPVP